LGIQDRTWYCRLEGETPVLAAPSKEIVEEALEQAQAEAEERWRPMGLVEAMEAEVSKEVAA
jgi:hypothetical protein